MGGNNEAENLVHLTPREHFIAHWLLWRQHRTKELAYAFHCMIVRRKKKQNFSSVAYAEMKEEMRKILSEKCRERFRGKKKSSDHIEKMRANAKKNWSRVSEKMKEKRFENFHPTFAPGAHSGIKSSGAKAVNLEKDGEILSFPTQNDAISFLKTKNFTPNQFKYAKRMKREIAGYKITLPRE
jgi:hypothetical protein